MTLVGVQLEQSSVTVPRGTRKTFWMVEHEGRWVYPDEIPGMEMDHHDRGVGTQSHAVYSLRLRVGTRLERFIYVPNTAESGRDLVELAARPGPRQRRLDATPEKRYYRVSESGRPVRESVWQARTERSREQCQELSRAWRERVSPSEIEEFAKRYKTHVAPD